MTSYVLPDKSANIAFIDKHQHAIQLLYQDNHWRANDVAAAAHAPAAIAGTALTSFVLSDGMPSIVYVDVHNHLEQVFYQDHHWKSADISAAAHAPLVSPGTALTSFVLPDGMPSVVLLDDRAHIVQMYFQDHSWHANDLTVIAPAPAALRDTALTAFVLPNGMPSILFVNRQHHIDQLFYLDNEWRANDLTLAAHARPALPGSDLSSFVLSDGMPSIAFMDAAQHVAQLYFQDNTWHSSDLTAASNAPVPAPGSRLSTFVFSGMTPYVFFVDANHHIEQLFFQDHRWRAHDLTSAAHASTPLRTSGLTSLTTSGGPSIAFLDEHDHLEQMYYQSSTWRVRDVSSSPGQ